MGDLDLIPGFWEDPPGEGNDYPLQYSGLENPVDCKVHGVAKSRTQLSDFHFISLGQSHFTNYNNIKFYKQDGIRIEMQ